MRRLEIAQALVNRPRILFLDEPTIGLDPASKAQVWSYIKRLSSEFATTIFITTHDMEEANELCQRLSIMNAGKIAVTGSPEEFKKDCWSRCRDNPDEAGKGSSVIATGDWYGGKVGRRIA